MRLLQTPVGFVVEDKSEGLYLAGDQRELSRAMKFVVRRERLGYSETHEDGIWTVEIGYGRDKPSPGDGAEWGKGSTREIAWRYALGAHFGSYDDPEVA